MATRKLAKTLETRSRSSRRAARSAPRPPRRLVETSEEPPFDVTPPGPVSKEFAQVIGRLVERTEEIADRQMEEIRKLPGYARLDDPRVFEEMRQLLPRASRLSYTLIMEGRLPYDEEMEAPRFYARRRFEQGISLRSLRSAYACGFRITWEALVREVTGDRALQRELLERSPWAFQHLDFFSAAVAEAYIEAREGRSRRQDQLARDLFDEIIDGDPETAAALEGRARAAGLDADGALRIVVVRRAPTNGRPDRSELAMPPSMMAAVAQAAGLSADDVLAAQRGGEVLLVLPVGGHPIDPPLFRKTVEAAFAANHSRGALLGGLSGRVAGAAELRQGYREAVRAIALGSMLEPHRLAHAYDDHVLHDVLDSTPEHGGRLIAQTIAPLCALGATGERLIGTLYEYFRAGLNLKVTAAALGIHRNTLTYRIRQAEDLTGLDLENPVQRLLVENALQALRLQRKFHEHRAHGDGREEPSRPGRRVSRASGVSKGATDR